ncbi:hypothetical protein BP00DRAFT_437304 [Aspergillus indologenus CBS 114.80]|uniref:Protein kinase domain-containing protein n=1 Tax=Aspergillus indologenus CBS 114.80 TaxID=1450541 RepID=A0A2V5I475_9EURO|nr:hypothetical protein BP00DRAFT_437304 [Aspergillus indologenus CBS 114.80]
MNGMGLAPLNVRGLLDQELVLNDQPITVTEVVQLDRNHPVYRVKIEQFDNLPRTGNFGGVPALILSEVVGTTLYDLARRKKLHGHKTTLETLESELERVFRTLSTYGAIYWDQKLDNFLLCDDEKSNNSRVMIVDLEQVQFPVKFQSWQLSVNREGARSLMKDIRDILRPNREPSPVRSWRISNGDCEDLNALGTTQAGALAQSTCRGDIEVPGYLVS